MGTECHRKSCIQPLLNIHIPGKVIWTLKKLPQLPYYHIPLSYHQGLPSFYKTYLTGPPDSALVPFSVSLAQHPGLFLKNQSWSCHSWNSSMITPSIRIEVKNFTTSIQISKLPGLLLIPDVISSPSIIIQVQEPSCCSLNPLNLLLHQILLSLAVLPIQKAPPSDFCTILYFTIICYLLKLASEHTFLKWSFSKSYRTSSPCNQFSPHMPYFSLWYLSIFGIPSPLFGTCVPYSIWMQAS